MPLTPEQQQSAIDWQALVMSRGWSRLTEEMRGRIDALRDLLEIQLTGSPGAVADQVMRQGKLAAYREILALPDECLSRLGVKQRKEQA